MALQQNTVTKIENGDATFYDLCWYLQGIDVNGHDITYESPIFCGINDSRWQLSLNIFYNKQPYYDNVYLSLVSSYSKYECSVLFSSSTSKAKRETKNIWVKGSKCGIDKFHNGYNSERERTIYCSIYMKKKFIAKIPCSLGYDLSYLFDNLAKDVTISIGEEEFPCHKLVLMSRSPVFKTMLETDMKESNENRIEITDTDPACMREMLSYIYTGETTPDFADTAAGVLALAEKYELKRLKSLCSDVLSSKLTPANVCETIRLADLYRAEQLKTDTIEFMLLNVADVIKAREENNCPPDVIADILKVVVGRFNLSPKVDVA